MNETQLTQQKNIGPFMIALAATILVGLMFMAITRLTASNAASYGGTTIARFDPKGGTYNRRGLTISYTVEDGFCKINGSIEYKGNLFKFDEQKHKSDNCEPMFLFEFIQKAQQYLYNRLSGQVDVLKDIQSAIDEATGWIIPFVQ